MTFSYEAGATPRDDVRLLIGDVDPHAMVDLRLEDEDIQRLIQLEGDTRRAAAMAAEVLAAKFARKAEGSVGPDVIRPSNRAQELRATAARLRSSAAAAAVPTSGGGADPAFRRNMLDHAGSR